MTTHVRSKFSAKVALCRLIGLLFLSAFPTGTMTSPETRTPCTEFCNEVKQVVDGGGEGEVGGGGRQERKVPVKPTVTIACVMESNSFLMRQSSPSGDIFAGYLDDLVYEISRTSSYHFQWLIVEPEVTGESRKYVSKWTELTEKLTSEKANISVLSLNPTIHNDSQSLSYSRPFLRSTLSLLLKAPSSTPDPRPLLLEELLTTRNSNRPKFGVVDETVAVQLKAFNSTLYRQIWGGKTPSEVVLTQEEGLRKVREENFILIMESIDAAYLSSTEPCDLVTSVQSTPETRYVFAALENSSLVVELDRILADIGMYNSDFFARLFKRWWDRDDCAPNGGERGRAGNFDADLDMERIFFTSPVKFFKGNLNQFNHDERISNSSAEYQFHGTAATKLTPKPSDANELAPQTPPERNRLVEAATPSKARDSNRKRRRTTSARLAPSIPTTVASQNRAITDDTDVARGNKRSTRFRFPSPSTSTARQLGKERAEYDHRTSQNRRHETADRVLNAQPTTSRHAVDLGQAGPQAGPDHAGYREYGSSEHRNIMRDKSDDRGTLHLTTFKTGAKVKTHGQFVNDPEWFFVTQEPRYPQEVDYDDEYDDEDDANSEQKAAYEALDSMAEVETVTHRHVPERPISSSNRIEILENLIVLNILSAFAVKHFGTARS